jgi:hypothetical protein
MTIRFQSKKTKLLKQRRTTIIKMNKKMSTSMKTTTTEIMNKVNKTMIHLRPMKKKMKILA